MSSPASKTLWIAPPVLLFGLLTVFLRSQPSAEPHQEAARPESVERSKNGQAVDARLEQVEAANKTAVAAPRVAVPASERSPVEAAANIEAAADPLAPAPPALVVHGRTVDATGAPISTTVLHAWLEVHDGYASRRTGETTRSDAQGFFQMSVPEPVRGALLAGAIGTGNGALELAHVNEDERYTIILHGPGVLRGRVVNEEGHPLPGILLDIVLAELDEHGESANSELGLLLARQGGGLARTRVATNDAGQFDVRGLRPDAYVIRALLRDGASLRMTAPDVLANGTELTLIAGRPQVIVRLREPNGAPWRGDLHAWPRFVRSMSGGAAWPRAPVVDVQRAKLSNGQLTALGSPIPGRSLGTDALVFTLSPGEPYLVSVSGPGFDGRARRVDAARGITTLEFQAQPFRTGRVLVDVFGRDGKPLVHGFHVSLEDPETGQTIAGMRSKPSSLGAPTLEAPAGVYRVVVESEPFGARALDHARSEVDARIDAGLDTRVRIELEPAARLRLTLEGRTSAEDFEALRATLLSSGVESFVDDLASLVSVWLERPGHRPRPVDLRTAERSDSMTEGGSWLIAPLPAGWFRVVARLPGGREVSQKIELRAGATTDLDLQF